MTEAVFMSADLLTPGPDNAGRRLSDQEVPKPDRTMAGYVYCCTAEYWPTTMHRWAVGQLTACRLTSGGEGLPLGVGAVTAFHDFP